MSTASKSGVKADTDGKITDYDIERTRKMIGVPSYSRVTSHDPVPSEAGISHFAFSYGDDNPLWHDPAYGANSRWGGQVAPPTYLSITGVDPTPPPSKEERAKTKREPAPFKGCGEYAAGFTWERFKPTYPGDYVQSESSLSGVDVREGSKFAGGRTVVRTGRQHYIDRLGQTLASHESNFVIAERSGSKKKDKHEGVVAQTYTDEDIAEIDAIYAAEEIRGAEPRYWEDVEVGDKLQPIAKGPLTVSDIIAEHLGRGVGHYGHGPLRYWWKARQRMPGFYTKNPLGIPDVVQRLHWEDDWANKVGLPIAYDYGDMRINWLSHVVTNWIGDDAWLWKLSCQIRLFNFIGDWHLMEGEVKAKRMEGDHCVVDLEIKGTCQRGWVTCPGTATVILPSREHGPVTLPNPPEHLVKRGAEIATETARRKRGG